MLGAVNKERATWIGIKTRKSWLFPKVDPFSFKTPITLNRAPRMEMILSIGLMSFKSPFSKQIAEACSSERFYTFLVWYTRCTAWPLTRPVSLATARRCVLQFVYSMFVEIDCSDPCFVVLAIGIGTELQFAMLLKTLVSVLVVCSEKWRGHWHVYTCVNPLDDDVAEVCSDLPSGWHLCAIGEVTWHAFVQMRFFQILCGVWLS